MYCVAGFLFHIDKESFFNSIKYFWGRKMFRDCFIRKWIQHTIVLLQVLYCIILLSWKYLYIDYCIMQFWFKKKSLCLLPKIVINTVILLGRIISEYLVWVKQNTVQFLSWMSFEMYFNEQLKLAKLLSESEPRYFWNSDCNPQTTEFFSQWSDV